MNLTKEQIQILYEGINAVHIQQHQTQHIVTALRLEDRKHPGTVTDEALLLPVTKLTANIRKTKTLKLRRES